LVTGGHKQVKGINYEETFAAAAKINSIWLILGIAANLDWELHQIDVVGAFLNGELKEEVFMEPPYSLLKPEDSDLVCLLNKSIYSLKQSPRVWKKKLTHELRELNFEPC
jgi:Reverse transcriptase (RNA-dependent DNA polymerase)